MNRPAGLFRNPFASRQSWQRTLAGTALLLVTAVVLSYPIQFFYARHTSATWQTVKEKRSTEVVESARQAFQDHQRAVRRLAAELAQNPSILQFLSARGAMREEVFDVISRKSRDQGVGMELYDTRVNLVAWNGAGGPVHRHEILIALEGNLSSFVSPTPLASQLLIVTPVRENGRILGALLLRKTIDLDYPLSSTLVADEGLSERLSREAGVSVRFNFSPESAPGDDSASVSAPVYGIDSAKVGTVTVASPYETEYLDRLAASFGSFRALLLAVILLGACAGAVYRVDGFASSALRIGAVTALLWLIRYALLALDVPSRFFGGGIFDAAAFASPFGGGLARSLGEVTLTALFLGVNAGYVARVGFNVRATSVPARGFLHRAGGVVLALLFTFALFWALRGYGAIIRSAIFDSTLVFNDPGILVPSSEQAVMLADLVLISVCVMSAAVGAASLLRQLLVRSFSERTVWFLLAGLFALGSVLFGVFQQSPLMSTLYRFLYSAAVLFSVSLFTSSGTTESPYRVRNVVTLFCLSVMFLYPLLAENAKEKDHQRVETFAREVLRPVDSWLQFVVDDALRGFVSESTAEAMLRGDVDEISALAFTHWAQSVACREGYASVFALVDTDRREVSRFSIGGQSAVAAPIDAALRDSSDRTTLVREVGRGVNATKVYAGSTPVADDRGRILGYARVIVIAGQQSLFRGENPPILRPAVQPDIASFYRRISVSEFRQGELATSSAGPFPIAYPLPSSVQTALADTGTNAAWFSENLSGQRYDTYFVRRTDPDSSVVALSLREPGAARDIVSVVRLVLFAALLLGLVGCAMLLWRFIRGERFALTFKGRLLVAFLITAIAPLVLITLYSRYHTEQRLAEATALRLQDQTSAVSTNIMMGLGRDETDMMQVTPPVAEAIASDLGTDFNLYIGDELIVSSRPELFEIGLLDRRISGGAYRHVVLSGERFFFENESIGRTTYAVGYRPVLDFEGAIMGVVSVPTLYRQDLIEEEEAVRNALLLSAYGMVLVFLLVLAASFAGRIAAPIQRLTEATKQVAHGNLDVTVTPIRMRYRAGDEIDELIRSFDAMTGELKRSRDELVRFERELAWKEMAKQVAHEIKNPLTPMRLSVQHLRQTFQDRVPDFDKVLESVTKTIVEQIDTLSRIASEFSHFARMPRREIAECDVNTLVRESLNLFAQEAGIRFETRLAEDIPLIAADREELRRAFINILRNSVQALEGRGKIVVATRKEKEGVRIAFRDFGPGIPEEVKAKLFQPNFSTKTDGMGLGLAIVKKTIDDLGGTVRIDSTLGEGTTVTIQLPATAGAAL